MTPRRLALWTLAVFLVSTPAGGTQRLELSFHEGRVTLVAEGVMVREVLEEWGRRGKTTVVNADLLGDRRVTLRLEGVPEAEAVEELLESAAGYVARRRTGTPGPSGFDLILVLATSDAPDSSDLPAPEAATGVPGRDREDEAPLVIGSSPEDVSRPADEDEALSSNIAVGRPANAQPSAPAISEVEVDAGPVEELPKGRPEGARAGPPVITTPAAPDSPAPAVPAPPASEPTDENGRPRPRPPGP